MLNHRRMKSMGYPPDFVGRFEHLALADSKLRRDFFHGRRDFRHQLANFD